MYNLSKKTKVDKNILKRILAESNYYDYGARKVNNLIKKIISEKKIKKICKNYSKN